MKSLHTTVESNLHSLQLEISPGTNKDPAQPKKKKKKPTEVEIK